MTFDLTQLESKVSEIKQWLGSLSGELQNESYEINEFTVSYLYHLCQLSKNTDKHLEQRIDDNLDKSEEYSVENERITKELQLFGIEENDLEKHSANMLSDLADIGNSLSLTHPTLENYLLNLSDYTLEELDLKDMLKKQELLLQSLSEKLEILDLTISKLSEEINIYANSREAEKIDIPVEIEKAKVQAQHYMESTKEFKKLLSASGIKKEYTHESLQKMSDKVTALSADIHEIEQKVAHFRQLPPSVPLVREKIRQTQVEIEAVEQEFPELSLS